MPDEKALNIHKGNTVLDSGALDLAKALTGEGLYQTTAIATYIIFAIIAFFISLGSAKFEWSKILEAQFWIDFTLTFGGSMFLKWVFGKWGMAVGMRHPNYVLASEKVEGINKEIIAKGLKGKLSEYRQKINTRRKINAIKRKVYRKLNRSGLNIFAILTKKFWLKRKEAILLTDKMLSTENGSEEIAKKLEELNFDIDAYKIKYPEIKESALNAGYSTGDGNEEKMSFSEWYELFGKSSLLSVVSLLLGLLLAVASLTADQLSWVTFVVFISRMGSFTINSVFGFISGRKAIEHVKYNILLLIHSFLATFIETCIKDNKEVI